MLAPPVISFDWESFGRDVRATMDERGMSTRDVGKRISVGSATVCRATQDKTVNVETLFSLCAWMGVDARDYCSERAATTG